MKKSFIIIMLLTGAIMTSWGQAEENSYFMSKAIQAFEEKDAETALTFAYQELEVSPENIKAVNLISEVYQWYNSYYNALNIYNEALNVFSPKNKEGLAAIHIEKSEIYFTLKEYDKALEELNEAQKLMPQNYLIYYNRAYNYMALNNFEAALKELHLLKKYKGTDINYTILEEIYCNKNLGKYDTYLQLIETALQSDTITDEIRSILYAEKVTALRLKGNYIEGAYTAIKCYEMGLSDISCLLTIPRDGVAVTAEVYKQHRDSLPLDEQTIWDYTLGLIHAENNINDKAIEYYMLHPEDKDFQIRIASSSVMASEKYYQTGIDFIDMALAENPSLQYNICKILLLTNMKEYDKALAILNTQIEENYTEADLYELRALINYQQQKYDEAIEDYSMALACNNEVMITYINRGLIYRLMGKDELAIKDFRTVTNPLLIGEDNASIERAISYALLEQKELATKELERYIEENKAANNTFEYQDYILMATTYHLLDDKSQAYATAEKAIEICPSRSVFMLSMPFISSLTEQPEFEQLFNTAE